MTAPRPHAILLLGPTGSGKTPLGQRLEARGLGGNRCVHFDFGDNLRRVAAQERPSAIVSLDDIQLIRRTLETGALLEDKDFPIAQRILQAFLDRRRVDDSMLVVLNGLPRHVGQAESMARIVDVFTVVCLSCSPETIVARIAANTGGDRTHRTDDDLSAVRRKLAIFSERTFALTEHYQAVGTKTIRLDVTARMTPEQMRTALERVLRQTMSGILMENELLGQFVSPQVHEDRRVTFRLRADQAEKVLVQGLAGLDPQLMTRNSDGLWELTLGPLAPELYSYEFNVDGMSAIDPHNRHVKKWLSLASLLEIPGDPPLLHEQQSVPHGVVHRHGYRSATTKSERGVLVYTPPGYSSDPTKCYPLVVLLHGYGDDESAWIEVGRANWMADNLLAQDKIRPMIIAMPYGHPLPIELNATFDDYANKNIGWMERDLLDDLLPYLSTQFRLNEGREHRAIVGLSMGGGQSLSIGLRHLNQFTWIGGFSSAAPQTGLRQQFADLLEDVSATNDRIRLLWIGCGKDDFLAPRNQQFVDWLNQTEIENTYRLTEGAHDWIVWRKHLAEFLPQLFR